MTSLEGAAPGVIDTPETDAGRRGRHRADLADRAGQSLAAARAALRLAVDDQVRLGRLLLAEAIADGDALSDGAMLPFARAAILAEAAGDDGLFAVELGQQFPVLARGRHVPVTALVDQFSRLALAMTTERVWA